MTSTRQVKLWTDDEIGLLLDNTGMDVQEIAELLGRSRQSIYAKRAKIKGGHVSSKEAWTESDDDFVLSNPGMKSHEVAESLGRAKTAVDKRRQYLHKKTGAVFDFRSNKNAHQPGDRRLLAKTCPDCGLMLDASWFGLNHSGHGKGWRKLCVRCRPHFNKPEDVWKGADTKRSREKLQAATVPAQNHGNPWTEQDHAILSDPDITVLDKALRLGRTYYATHSMCSDNGYRSLLGKGDPVKGQWIIQAPNAYRFAA